MEIREYRTYNEKEILGLYASVGWTAYTGCPEALRKGFENSMLTLAAYEGENHCLLQIHELLRTVRNGLLRVYESVRGSHCPAQAAETAWISLPGGLALLLAWPGITAAIAWRPQCP